MVELIPVHGHFSNKELIGPSSRGGLVLELSCQKTERPMLGECNTWLYVYMFVFLKNL